MTEMPEEIFIYKAKDSGQIYLLPDYQTELPHAVKYIRADLAEKPALDDAEVMEATEGLAGYFALKGYEPKGQIKKLLDVLKAAQSQNKNGEKE